MDPLACINLQIADTIDTTHSQVARAILSRFSRKVEPFSEVPGVFWMEGAGLNRLYATLEEWGKAMLRQILPIAPEVALVVGFTKFGTYALTRTGPGLRVMASLEKEQAEVSKVPLRQLHGFPPAALHVLAKLGRRTVGDLLTLSPVDISTRFGKDVAHVYAMARGERATPIHSPPIEEPLEWRLSLDFPEEDRLRLTFLIKRTFPVIVKTVATRHQAISAMDIVLRLANRDKRHLRMGCAAPTLDEEKLVELIRLSLESQDIAFGVEEVIIQIHAVPGEQEQQDLFQSCPGRDKAAAEAVFAKLRAQFGENAVVRAVLKDGHLPEAHFQFSPLYKLPPPKTSADLRMAAKEPETPSLVRRIYARPQSFEAPKPSSGHKARIYSSEKKCDPHVSETKRGPYIVSGGWWLQDVHREYYFTESTDGRIAWVYFDTVRGRWMEQGAVE